MRIVLFNASQAHFELGRLLDRFGVESIEMGAFERAHRISSDLEVEISRFLCYYHWLAENPVGSVVLADVLDVLWQGPIPPITHPGITVFHENVIAAECPYNSKWIREVWPDTYPELEFNQVICCGIIMGHISGIGMQTYLAAYEIELAKRKKVKRGFDSAVLAGIAHANPISVSVQPYPNQDCMHLGYADPVTVRISDGVVHVETDTPDGLMVHIPAIVHQYNRHAVTEEIYKRWST